MREHTIIITGSVGAGKTTAINAVSEVPPIALDVANNDFGVDKGTTTVDIDYGQLTLDNGDRVRLFGTPSQSRFSFVWQMISKGALGLIILTDNSRPDALADLNLYLDGFAHELSSMPCVIGVGRSSQHEKPSLDRYAAEVHRAGHLFPVVPVDVRKKEDVIMLIDSLLSQLEADQV